MRMDFAPDPSGGLVLPHTASFFKGKHYCAVHGKMEDGSREMRGDGNGNGSSGHSETS